MQTTFINAQKGLRRGVTPQFELAWLFKIARNVCYNARASASRRGRLEAARDLDGLQDELPTPDRDAGVALSDLTAALGSIPERQRHALLLREFQGLSYEEIAAQLGVTVAAVETLLFRARRSVAGRLEQAGTRASALTSLFGSLRWLLPGGAKVAALAATATLAVTPGMYGPAPTTAPAAAEEAAPPSPTFVAGIDGRVPAAAPVKPALVETVAAARPPSSTETSPAAGAIATQTPTAPSTTAAGDLPSVAPASAPPVTETPTTSPPTATTPELPPLPPVEVPDLSVTDTQLPAVELPPLPAELPLEVPTVPEVQLP